MGKILNVGRQEITVRHFTTEITNLPFIMDANCFMVFSHLWRKYIASSANENLITDEGWFQYPLKSLAHYCGFMDMGTLRRAVEGLYRSDVVDVRVEEGSRLWACWKMNKTLIEKLSSLSDRDAMDEPYLKSIESIESKDKDYTYLENKEGIEELKVFFGVKKKGEKPPNSVENPPLLNTIIQEHNNTIKQHYSNTIPQYYDKTTEQQNDKTTELEHKSTLKQQNHTDVVEGNSEDFEFVTEEVNENQNEPKSQIEGNDDSNRYQPFENNLLSPSENSKITKTLEGLDFYKNSLDSNTFNECMRLLLEVATSSKDSYMNNATKVKKDFNEVMKGCSRDQRKPFSEAFSNFVSILGTAFHN